MSPLDDVSTHVWLKEAQVVCTVMCLWEMEIVCECECDMQEECWVLIMSVTGIQSPAEIVWQQQKTNKPPYADRHDEQMSWLQDNRRKLLEGIFCMWKHTEINHRSQLKPEDFIVQTHGARVIWAVCHGRLQQRLLPVWNSNLQQRTKSLVLHSKWFNVLSMCKCVRLFTYLFMCVCFHCPFVGPSSCILPSRQKMQVIWHRQGICVFLIEH